jgi:hypothetical protein
VGAELFEELLSLTLSLKERGLFGMRLGLQGAPAVTLR